MDKILSQKVKKKGGHKLLVSGMKEGDSNTYTDIRSIKMIMNKFMLINSTTQVTQTP